MFSLQTLTYLKESGWHVDRRIDIARFKESLLGEGFTMFPIVESFLAEFGDLNIVFLLNNEVKDSLHFNVKQSVEEVDPLWAQKDYYKRLGNKQLCIIGQVHANHMTLMMTKAGEVYGGFDEFLCKIADNGVDAIERLCNNIRGEEIL